MCIYVASAQPCAKMFHHICTVSDDTFINHTCITSLAIGCSVRLYIQAGCITSTPIYSILLEQTRLCFLMCMHALYVTCHTVPCHMGTNSFPLNFVTLHSVSHERESTFCCMAAVQEILPILRQAWEGGAWQCSHLLCSHPAGHCIWASSCGRHIHTHRSSKAHSAQWEWCLLGSTQSCPVSCLHVMVICCGKVYGWSGRSAETNLVGRRASPGSKAWMESKIALCLGLYEPLLLQSTGHAGVEDV